VQREIVSLLRRNAEPPQPLVHVPGARRPRSFRSRPAHPQNDRHSADGGRARHGVAERKAIPARRFRAWRKFAVPARRSSIGRACPCAPASPFHPKNFAPFPAWAEPASSPASWRAGHRSRLRLPPPAKGNQRIGRSSALVASQGNSGCPALDRSLQVLEPGHEPSGSHGIRSVSGAISLRRLR